MNPMGGGVPYSTFTAMDLLDNSATQAFADGMGAPWPPVPVVPPVGGGTYDGLNGELFPTAPSRKGGYGVQHHGYHHTT